MTETTDPALPDVADQAGMSVNIYIPDAPPQATPIYSYFRIGQPSADPETTLPSDVTVPGTPGASSTSPFPEGGLLYTTGTITLTAPTTNIVSPSVIIDATSLTNPPVSDGISAFTPSTLSAVVNGSQLCSASLTTNGESASIFHNRPANVTFQNVDQLTMTEGASSNFLTGDALTFWTGNDQSIGFGGLLWANVGVTSNLFGGMIVNVTNDGAEIQGYGEYKVTKGYGATSPDTVSLKVDPSTASAVAFAETVTAYMNRIMALGTLVAGAYSAAVLTEINLVDANNADALKKRMTKTNEDLETMTMLVVGVQALSVILGVVLQVLRPVSGAEATSELSLGNLSALLSAGPTSVLSMTPLAVTLTADDPVANIRLMAGNAVSVRAASGVSVSCGPATSIAMTPMTLSLTAGPTSIVLGPNGITMNGVQISTNALQAAFAPVVLPPPLPLPQALVIDVEAEEQEDLLMILGSVS